MSTPYTHINTVLANHTSVLDIGCGSFMFGLIEFYKNGHFTKLVGIDQQKKSSLFTQAVYKEIGQDWTSAIMVSKKFTYIQFDLSNGHIPCSEKFDVITLSQVLHFFPKQARENICRWCHAHLNPGGILFIRANHTQSKHITENGMPAYTSEGELYYSDGKLTYFLLEPYSISFDDDHFKELYFLGELNLEYFTRVYQRPL